MSDRDIRLRLAWRSASRKTKTASDPTRSDPPADQGQTAGTHRPDRHARGKPPVDFITPGLLGSAKQFSLYAKALAERTDNPYGPLRELVRPYILRRMKTDKAIIADLPDKTEIAAYCSLSRRQAALYEQAVQDLQKGL